jgi:hypothetical protein
VLSTLRSAAPQPHPGPTLRFGGNSADTSGWSDDPAAPRPPGMCVCPCLLASARCHHPPPPVSMHCWLLISCAAGPRGTRRSNYAITRADLEAYTAFASQTALAKANVSLIIDTNFGTSVDPQRFGVPHIKALLAQPGLLAHVSAVEVRACLLLNTIYVCQPG